MVTRSTPVAQTKPNSSNTCTRGKTSVNLKEQPEQRANRDRLRRQLCLLYSDVTLERCGVKLEKTRLTAVLQLAKAAVVCPEWADVLVKKLLRSCGSDDCKVKARAMAGLARAASVCRGKARQILAILMCGCTDEDDSVSDAAKEHLELVLKACPEVAVNIVAELIQTQSLEDTNGDA